MKEINRNRKTFETHGEIFVTANELFQITMLDTKTLKTFLYNLLLLDEIKLNILDISKPFTEVIRKDVLTKSLTRKIYQMISEELINYFANNDIYLEDEILITRISDLFDRQSEKNIEKRYQRIVRTVMHLFNTPITSIAIILNIEREALDRILGEVSSSFGEPLILPNSWRDRILKTLNYYTKTYSFGLQQKHLLNFFKGYIKLTNIIEILNKDTISSEERQLLVKNIGEPMIEITGGLVNYRDAKTQGGEPLNLTNIITELKDILFNILSLLGKEPSPTKSVIFTNNMLYSMASLLAVGADTESLKYINEEDARKAEKLRLKLAKLLIEKYKIEIEAEGEQVIYEGELIWRDILINRELSKNKASVFTLLGIPVKNLSTPIKYEKFLT